MTYEELNSNIDKKIAYIKEKKKNATSEIHGEDFWNMKLVAFEHLKNDVKNFTAIQKTDNKLLNSVNSCIQGFLSDVDSDY